MSLEYLPENKKRYTNETVAVEIEDDPLDFYASEDEINATRSWSVRLAIADCKVEKNGNMILIKDPSGLEFRLREQKFNFSLVF